MRLLFTHSGPDLTRGYYQHRQPGFRLTLPKFDAAASVCSTYLSWSKQGNRGAVCSAEVLSLSVHARWREYLSGASFRLSSSCSSSQLWELHLQHVLQVPHCHPQLHQQCDICHRLSGLLRIPGTNCFGVGIWEQCVPHAHAPPNSACRPLGKTVLKLIWKHIHRMPL